MIRHFPPSDAHVTTHPVQVKVLQVPVNTSNPNSISNGGQNIASVPSRGTRQVNAPIRYVGKPIR